MKKIYKKNQRKTYSNLQTLQVQPTIVNFAKRVGMDTGLGQGHRATAALDVVGCVQREVWWCEGKVSDSFFGICKIMKELQLNKENFCARLKVQVTQQIGLCIGSMMIVYVYQDFPALTLFIF